MDAFSIRVQDHTCLSSAYGDGVVELSSRNTAAGFSSVVFAQTPVHEHFSTYPILGCREKQCVTGQPGEASFYAATAVQIYRVCYVVLWHCFNSEAPPSPQAMLYAQRIPLILGINR
jgi:hypothetical protein